MTQHNLMNLITKNTRVTNKINNECMHHLLYLMLLQVLHAGSLAHGLQLTSAIKKHEFLELFC